MQTAQEAGFAVGNAESYDIIGNMNAKRNVDVYRRNMMCVRMTRTLQQECGGIFEGKKMNEMKK